MWRLVTKPLVRDVLVAALTLAANLALTPPAFEGDPLLGHASPPAWLIVLVATFGAVPLCWRSRNPLSVFGAVWLLALPVLLFIGDYRPILVVLVALFAASRSARLWQSFFILGASLVTFVPVVAVEARDTDQFANSAALLVGITIYALVVVSIWVAGRWAAKSHRRVLEIELQRDTAARHAVTTERRRIARELHDSVAHSISLITIQAAGALKVLRHDPERAELALDSIDDLGRQTVDELQRLLGVLRAEVPDLIGETTDELARDIGQPSLTRASEVLANMADAGLTVNTDVVGTPGHLDPSVDSAAFRVLQESLTNVLKHAGPEASTSVITVWAPDRLILEVTNSAPTSPRPTSSVGGHGLLGLRERAIAVGGELDAEMLQDNRFRVTASLPRPRDGATPQ